MCGIAGRVGIQDGLLEDVKQMLDCLVHRGPDAEFTVADGPMAMGMRRLSIVDLHSGHQPYQDESGRVSVVFNGEIYNAPQLRSELESRGHHFKSDHSDGEVIPHLYEDLGIHFAHKLEGMFAIALWDARKRKLLLVRDHFGIKPLYYAVTHGSISFASELKSLLALGDLPRQLDVQALDSYHRLGYVPGPSTAFLGMDQLGPADVLVWQDGGASRHRYWNATESSSHFSDIESAAEAVRIELRRSVRSQLQADVPIAAFLSGGVDSSAVVALAAAEASDSLATFALVYPGLDSAGKSRDALLARKISEIFDTDHVEVSLTAADFVRGIPEVVRAFDQPFAGAISTFYLSAYVANTHRVAMTGDGADEMFGSYLFHRASAWRDWAHAGPDMHPADFALTAEDIAVAKGCRSPAALRLALARRYSPLPDVGCLYSAAFLERLASARAGAPVVTALDNPLFTSSVTRGSWLNTALQLDQASQLPDEVLAFSDRLSMAHSLELRPPFLSTRMAEVAAGLPYEWKVSPQEVKRVLRMSLTNVLPGEVLHRPKEGFVPPIKEWLRGDLAEWVGATLTPERTDLHGIWHFPEVAKLLAGMEGDPQRYFKKVWTLAMFQVWWEGYCSVI